MGAAGQIYPPDITTQVNWFERVNVYVKQLWSDTWTLTDGWLQPLAATNTVGPGIGSASFLWRYGRVWTSSTGWLTRYAENAIGWFVQIRLPLWTDEAVLWTGVFVDDLLDAHGAEVASVPAGNQELRALDLGYLLDRQRLYWANAYHGETLVELDHVPPMNWAADRGPSVRGNRSTSADGDDIYHFSADGASWTHQQFLAMVLNDYAPDGLTYQLTGQYDLLNNLVTTAAMEGLTVKQTLDRLVDRRRGFGWRIGQVGTAAGAVIPVEIFTVFEEAITIDDVTIDPNAAPMELAVADSVDVDPAAFELTEVGLYDTIRVRGELIRSCFSLYADDTNGELEAAWTSTQETAYKSGASGMTGYGSLTEEEKAAENDRYRADERFSRVYRMFRLPNTWDWKAAGATAAVINPTCKRDGSINWNTQGQYVNFNRRFLRTLPLQVGVAYTGSSPTDNNPDNAEPEYLPPLVWGKYGGKYYQVDRWSESVDGAPAMGVRMSDRELAFEVLARPNLHLGKNHFDTGSPEPSDATPLFDWRELVATLAIATDQRLEVVVAATSRNAGAGRELVIDVPGAEAWVIASGTVVGVDDEGALETYGGSSQELRNDVDMLKAIAAVARGWYGKYRQVLKLRYKYLADYVQPGRLVTAVSSDLTYQPINTVITQQIFDFASGTTSIMTDFAQLDFGRLGSGLSSGGPELGDARVLANTLRKTERDIRELKAETGNLPVRQGGAVAAAAGGSLSVARVVSDADGRGCYNCYLQTLDADDWNSATASDPLDDTGELVVVLNLPEAGSTVHDLDANVLLFCWAVTDDAGNSRYVGHEVLGRNTFGNW